VRAEAGAPSSRVGLGEVGDCFRRFPCGFSELSVENDVLRQYSARIDGVAIWLKADRLT
jgi:hypothetical protein